MTKPIDLTGQRFGRLLVLQMSPERRGKRKDVAWICRCDCGKITCVVTGALRHGHSKSCGCLNLEILRAPREHRRNANHKRNSYRRRWKAMVSRCTNPLNHAWKDYGGRGIKVCDRWLDFENFYQDMGDPPDPSYTLDRIDNNGPYSPENCRWVTRAEQQRNRRNNLIIEAFGERKCLMDWARDERCRVGDEGLRRRIKHGWEPESAITTISKNWKGNAL